MSKLAVINKRHMEVKLETVIGSLRSLHAIAIDKGAKKNLKRAMISTQNALNIYKHHNSKPYVGPRKNANNPQKASYPWMR